MISTTLALFALAASACATPIEHASALPGRLGIHKVDTTGAMLSVNEPGRMEYVNTGAIPASGVRSGWLKVEDAKTEGLFDDKQAGMGGWFVVDPAKSESLYDIRRTAVEPRFIAIRGLKETGGKPKIEPLKSETMFTVKSDAMQQSQQLEEGAAIAPRLMHKDRGSKIVRVEPGKYEYVKADAMQQQQQLGHPEHKYIGGRRYFCIDEAKEECAKPAAKYEYEYVTEDAMQQQQQLDDRHRNKRVFDYYPTRSEWLKVEPLKTERLFHVKGDDLIPLAAVAPLDPMIV